MTKNILVLCTGNSARSIIGECLLNDLGKGTINAKSAGSTPTGKVNPFALKLLKSKGYKTTDFRSKSWNEFGNDSQNPFDIVITVCDNAASETCPIWPGSPISTHWGLFDPAGVDGTDDYILSAFEQAYLILKKRVEAFLALNEDEITKENLDRIGKL